MDGRKHLVWSDGISEVQYENQTKAQQALVNFLKRIFPDRTAVDLPLDHPIFHSVYDFKAKPQIPTAGAPPNWPADTSTL